MKYDIRKFNHAVNEYTGLLKGSVEKKTIVFTLRFENKEAYYSLAPLSRALDELKADVRVFVITNGTKTLKIVNKVWNCHDDLQKGVKNDKTKALKDFITVVNNKTKNTEFNEIFKRPDIEFIANENGFISKDWNFNLPYHASWFKPRKWGKLVDTAELILNEVFGLRKGELFSVGFNLIPNKKFLDLPLDDYLDNFAIAYAFVLAAIKLDARASLGAATARESKLEKMDRVSDLITTLGGCEYEKKIDMPVFQKFKKLSKLLGIDELEFSTASFGIHGKGYGGKHFFGLNMGYPSLDKKTVWDSPGSMFLKAWWYPQTKIDKREPIKRVAITETLPIERLIETTNIKYDVMRAKNDAIKRILEKCDELRVIANRPTKGYKTDMTVDLKGAIKDRVRVMASDSDVTFLIDQNIKKTFGVNAGMFANVPGGEAFFTPESISGIAVGDVVINIDRSRVITPENPVIVKMDKGRYEIIKGPKSIMDRIKKEMKDINKLIKEYEHKKVLPEGILKMHKDNLYRIGEFAINTNPKAKLGLYLIENEKIARMMHIALGSGFEPHRQTLYHWDMVINNPRQKMDIYGMCTGSKKKYYIIKNGNFVI
ncbi:MAG: hypothetical protein COT15_00820 [Candidatus Diapherotrites archaeon CG08_land_8_20_14_0_20_34_12]|nr:MAG: hypothetical protein COT15_00820 [Candidatus Diapherotrites archaeon CG08_land_8_20_14_0_20_34_12]